MSKEATSSNIHPDAIQFRIDHPLLTVLGQLKEDFCSASLTNEELTIRACYALWAAMVAKDPSPAVIKEFGSVFIKIRELKERDLLYPEAEMYRGSFVQELAPLIDQVQQRYDF